MPNPAKPSGRITALTDGVCWFLGACAIGYMFLATLDVLLHRDIVLTADALLRCEEWLFHVPLYLCVLAIFGAKINGRDWALAVFMAFVASETKLFSLHLHNFLTDFDLYPGFARHPGVSANVQWPILLSYALCWPILLVQVIIRKTRHIGRIFMLVITTATLGTTLLFHQLVIGVALKETLNDAREHQMQIMHRLARGGGNEFGQFEITCHHFQLWCAQGTIHHAPPSDFAAWARRPDLPLLDIQRRSFNPLSRTLDGQQAIYTSIPAPRWIIDRMSYTPIIARHKIIFAVLVSVAHLVWSWGGIGLLALHRSPVRFRLRGNA